MCCFQTNIVALNETSDLNDTSVSNLVPVSSASASDDGHCIWYGVCADRGNHKLYCSYNGTAKPLDPAGKKLLSKWCPQLLDRNNGLTCCDQEQVNSFFFFYN